MHGTNGPESASDPTEIVPLRGSFVTDSLVEDLRKQILAGTLKPGDPIMPVRALSKAYKISYNSVRRALGQLARDGFISLERGRGTFVKPQTNRIAPRAEQSPAAAQGEARVLRKLPGRQSIGVLFHAGSGVLFSAPCYRDTLAEVQKQVLSNGDVLTVVTGTRTKPFPTPEQVLTLGLDGLFLMGIVDRKMLAAFADAKLPCVVLDHWPGDIPLNCVVVDNFTGAYLLTKTLIHQGHREICFLRFYRAVTTDNPERLVEPDAAEREDACRLALKEEGMVLRQSHVLDTTHAAENSTPLADRILALQPRPTGIFALGTDMGGHLIEQFRERGLDVPRDLSIVAFGSKGEDDPYRITAAKADFRKMGEAGIGRLRQLMDGAPNARLRINVPVEVVDGQTVGPPPKGSAT